MSFTSLEGVGTNFRAGLDHKKKVHGILPKFQDIKEYSREELEMLLDELKESIPTRIEVTIEKGRDRNYGQRQGLEQDLIKRIEKYLSGS